MAVISKTAHQVSRAVAAEEKTNQRITARDGQQDDLLPDRGFFDGLFAFARDASLLPRHQHERVFGEVDAALIAFPAMPLRRRARRTLEEHRRVAPTAKCLRVTVHRLAFGAFHAPILTRRVPRPRSRPPHCAAR